MSSPITLAPYGTGCATLTIAAQERQVSVVVDHIHEDQFSVAFSVYDALINPAPWSIMVPVRAMLGETGVKVYNVTTVETAAAAVVLSAVTWQFIKKERSTALPQSIIQEPSIAAMLAALPNNLLPEDDLHAYHGILHVHRVYTPQALQHALYHTGHCICVARVSGQNDYTHTIDFNENGHFLIPFVVIGYDKTMGFWLRGTWGHSYGCHGGCALLPLGLFASVVECYALSAPPQAQCEPASALAKASGAVTAQRRFSGAGYSR